MSPLCPEPTTMASYRDPDGLITRFARSDTRLPLIPASRDDLAQAFVRTGANERAMGKDHGSEPLRQQLLGGSLRQRRVRAEGFAQPYPDLARQAPEGVGGEQNTVFVAQQRDVPQRVPRCRDDPEPRHQVPLAQYLPNRSRR